MPTERNYTYRLRSRTLWCLVAATALGIVLAGLALATSSSPVQLRHPSGMPWAWLLGLGLVVWLAYLSVLVRTQLQGGRIIRLAGDRLIAPPLYWSRDTVAIPYARISGLDFAGNRSRLWVLHEGLRLGIAAPYFASAAAFDEFMDELQQRVALAPLRGHGLATY